MAAKFLLLMFGCFGGAMAAVGAEWPQWRGPAGSGVSDAESLPMVWDTERNVRWKAAIAGEGSSSPIVWQDRVLVTSAEGLGRFRRLHCLDRKSGRQLWVEQIVDDDPEPSSSMTGHAAATPATDGRHVVAFFGNAGVVCYDFRGRQRWHRDLGHFESELGFASSPILHEGRVILVCDHDGNRFKTFDSFLISLDLATGKTVWRTDRPGLFRSWSTPIVVSLPADDDAPGGDSADRQELIVNAQEQLRGYDLASGRLRWQVDGMTDWVTPSPVFGDGLILATSGRDGPLLAVRPGGLGDVSETHVAWRDRGGTPYVCSPLWYQGLLYVINEQGIFSCYEARTGKRLYRERLEGKFVASPVAGDGKVYVTNDKGTTFVVRHGTEFEVLSENVLDGYTLASPAICDGELFVRTESGLYCIGGQRTAVGE